MVILDKTQVETEIRDYKEKDKIKIRPPDLNWTSYHFNKAEYNLRIARINFNLNARPDFIKELEHAEEPDPGINTYEWVIIMSYYAMFHSVNALLRKIGVEVGKQYAHEITTNLLLHYFYYTKIIEDELLKNYERAEEKAKELVVSYIFAKEERSKYQYRADTKSQEDSAAKILDDAADFVSRLKELEKTLSRELVLAKSAKRTL